MKRRLEIRLERAHLFASLRTRMGDEWSAGAAATTPDQLHAGLVEMLQLDTIRHARPRVRVLIGAPVAQCRLLHDLPSVGARDLTALVANQCGRFFRKNGVPLVTTARWVDRRHAGGLASAISVAVEEPWITAIESAIATARLSVCRITPIDCPELVLQSPNARTQNRRLERRQLLRLAAGSGLVWMAAAGVALLRQHVDLRWLRQEQAQLSAPALAISDAQRHLHEAMGSIATIRKHDRHRGAALASLVAVINALPDSAYLQGYQWHADESGSLSGAGPDAAQVLARLAGRTTLPALRLRGPASREASTGPVQERFEIEFGNTAP